MITIDDSEIAAVLRAILEAKFRADPFDQEIPDSELLARVAVRLSDDLHRLDARRLSAAALERSEAWRSLTPDRREWHVALEFAKSHWPVAWAKWSEAQRWAAMRSLLSPFRVSDELLAEFAAAIDACMPAGSTR